MHHRGSRATSVLFAAAVILAVGSVAQAQQFRPALVEGAGGLPPFEPGFAGFRTSSGGFYNRQGNTTTTAAPSDPTIWVESSTNHIAYDSYVTLSPNGPSRLSAEEDAGDTLSPQIRSFYGYADTHASNIPIAFYSPGIHIGDSTSSTGQPPHAVNAPVDRVRGAVANGEPNTFQSEINPINGREAVFIAQITVNRGSTLTGTMRLSDRRSQELFVDIPLILDGPPTLSEVSPGVFRLFSMRSYLVATHDDLSHSRSGGNQGTGSGSAQRFGPADVYHVWIDLDPQPTCLGDANRDGAVNFSDITTVLANFGNSDNIGDSNFDRVTNFADVTRTLSSFGAVCQ